MPSVRSGQACRRQSRRTRLVSAVFALTCSGTVCTSAHPAPEPKGSPGRSTTQHTQITPGNTSAEGLRVKGLVPHLLIHRKQGSQVDRLSHGAMAHPGDLVQISYVAAGNEYGVVLSVDGRGTVTLHHPERADLPARLVARGEHALGHAYELDDAEAFERFILVTSGREPLDIAEVLTAARRVAAQDHVAQTAPLPLPSRWRQTSTVLHKVGHP